MDRREDQPRRVIRRPARIPDWISFKAVVFVALYLLLIELGSAAMLFGGPATPWVLPVFATVLALFVLYRCYADEDLPQAVWEMLLAGWWMTVGMLLGFHLMFPITVENGTIQGVAPVPNGEAYVVEMSQWIATEEGPEGDAAQFIPIHLRHFGIVGGSSLVSGGSVALFFGAVQMCYMNAYVYSIGSLPQSYISRAYTHFLAWHVWSVIRVFSFIMLATILGYPAFCLVYRQPIPWLEIGMWVLGATALEALDMLLKWQLAEPVRQMLIRLTGL